MYSLTKHWQSRAVQCTVFTTIHYTLQIGCTTQRTPWAHTLSTVKVYAGTIHYTLQIGCTTQRTSWHTPSVLWKCMPERFTTHCADRLYHSENIMAHTLSTVKVYAGMIHYTMQIGCTTQRTSWHTPSVPWKCMPERFNIHCANRLYHSENIIGTHPQYCESVCWNDSLHTVQIGCNTLRTSWAHTLSTVKVYGGTIQYTLCR